jgi:FG-GAP repeat protein
MIRSSSHAGTSRPDSKEPCGSLLPLPAKKSRGLSSSRAAHNFPVGMNPVSIATGDLNGDGKTDIVTANVDGGDISVLLNTSM